MAIIGISGYAGSGKDTVGRIIQYLQCTNVGDTTLEDVLKYEDDHAWWLEEQSGWEIKKWAGKLKQIASLLTGIPEEEFENQEFKKTYLGPEWDTWGIIRKEGHRQVAVQATPHDPDGPWLRADSGTEVHNRMTVREFLQKLGTDGLRNGLHPNVWINALMADYKSVWNDPDPIPGNEYTITYRENYGETSLIHYGGGSEAEVFNHEITEPNWIITDTRFLNEAKAIKDKGGILIRVDRPGVKAINDHPSEIELDDYPFDYKIMNGSDLVSLMFTVHNILKKEKIIE